MLDTQYDDVVDIINNLAGRLDEVEQTLSDPTAGVQLTDTFPNGITIGSTHFGTPVTPIGPSISPVPGALTLTTGTFFNDIFIDASWTAPADNTASTYYVELAKKSGSSYLPVAATVIAGTSNRFHGLDPDSTYGVRVTARNRAGVPAASNPVAGFTDQVTTHDATIPGIPSGLVVTAGVRSLIVRFSDLDPTTYPDVANGAGTYEVQVATDSAFTTNLKVNIGSALVVAIPDLLPATMYYVKVRAIDRSGNVGSFTASATATTGLVLSGDVGFGVGNGNYVRNGNFGGTHSYYTPTGGSTDTPYDDWWGYNWYPSTADPAITFAIYTTRSFYGPASARLTWTTNTGNKGLRQAIPVNQNTITWPANSTWIISIWVWTLANPGIPHLGADVVGFTDTYVTNPTAVVNGGWQRWDIKRVVGGADISTNLYVAWAHANGDLLIGAVQVTLGDTPLSGYSPRPDEIIARSVIAGQMAVGTITVGSGVIGSLDAGTITVGTMSADFLTVNTFHWTRILDGDTITTKTIYIGAGGQVVVGNTTTGVVMNSQGLRLYSGGSAVIALDVSGTATISGSVTVSGTLNVSGWVIAQSPGGFATATSGQRILIGGGGYEISFYTGYSLETNRGWVQVGNSGYLQIASPTINNGGTYEQSIITMSANQTVFYSYGGQRLVIADNGVCMLGNGYNGRFYAGDGSWAFGVSSPRPGVSSTSYATYMGYYGDGGVGSPNNMVGCWDSHSTSYPFWCDGAGIFHYATSSRKIKTNIRRLDKAGESSIEKIKKIRPVRFHHKKATPESRIDRVSLIAEEVLEVYPEGAWAEIDETLPAHLDMMGLMGLVFHAMQEQDAQIIELKKEVAQFKKQAA